MLIALIQNWCHTIIIIIIALVLKMLFFICIEFVGHLEIIYSCGFAAKCFFVAYFLGLLSNTFEISREIALLSCRTFLKAFSPIQAKMDIFCWWVKYQPVNRLTKYWNSGQWLPDPTSPDSLVPSTSTQVTWTRGTRGEYFSGLNIFQGGIFFRGESEVPPGIFLCRNLHNICTKSGSSKLNQNAFAWPSFMFINCVSNIYSRIVRFISPSETGNDDKGIQP